MAIGYEFWLAVRGAEAQRELAATTGTGLADLGRDREDFDGGKLEELNAALALAHAAAMARLSAIVPGDWKRHGEKRGLAVWQTPFGMRETIPFSLYSNFDDTEMGDQDEDHLSGVALSGRYFPTFLDIHDEHGGLHTISLDGAFHAMVAVAREEIENAVPALAGMPLVLKLRHY